LNPRGHAEPSLEPPEQDGSDRALHLFGNLFIFHLLNFMQASRPNSTSLELSCQSGIDWTVPTPNYSGKFMVFTGCRAGPDGQARAALPGGLGGAGEGLEPDRRRVALDAAPGWH
jgi:hypothetical protein